MSQRITNEGIAELLDVKIAGLKAEIKASADFTGYKIDELKEDLRILVEYQKVQNGKINTIEDETRIFRLIHRNPKVSLIILILIIIGSFTVLPLVLKAIF